MKRSKFITAALESLQSDTTVPVSNTSYTPPKISETLVDSSVDAVAELMEKNSELEDKNASLETESFDNDLSAAETVSDSVSEDLDEAVAAGAALEELAYVVNMAVKTGQANRAAVAGYALALEQMSIRAGLTSPMAALESDALQLEGPEGQAKTIAETASSKAKEIGRKLIEGIKKIIGYLLNVIRSLFAHAPAVAKRARALVDQLDSIDKSKTIDSTVFISSMRLVEGGGDPSKQFEDYGHLATKTLYGFIDNTFGQRLSTALDDILNAKVTTEQAQQKVTERLTEMSKLLMSHIFTENGNGADISARIPEGVTEQQLTVSKTQPSIGGLQLALAVTLEAKGKEGWFFHAGPSKTQPKIETPDSIPVVDKIMAKQYLGLIQKWMKDHNDFHRVFSDILRKNFVYGYATNLNDINRFMNVLTAIATGTMPYLLRLNMQNSTKFLAYVEKSISVSKGAAESEDK